MSFEFSLPLPQEPVDWDQFLVDEDLHQKVIALEPSSPSVSDSATATPRSTESEQSLALDVTADDFDFTSGFDFVHAGIMHSPEDVHGLPAYEATPVAATTTAPTVDESLKAALPDWQGAFGDFTGLGNDAAVELGLTNLIGKLSRDVAATAPAPVEASPVSSVSSPSLAQAYAALGWTTPTVEPASLAISPRPLLKRKDTDTSVDSAPVVKRPRGRPPKSRSMDVAGAAAAAKRPAVRRPSEGSPLARSVAFADDADSESDSPKVTASGKLSTARPKSVVPEKYFKDGSAQAILGMTVDEIQSFPTFEELLKQVEPCKREAAAEFGSRIADNRDKAKDAAKKSREERKAKIDTLERTVMDLEGKIQGLQGVLLALVARGVISQADVAAHL